MRKPQLMLIEWQDSLQPVAGWHTLADRPALEVAECSSVGWIVAEDAKAIMLAQNVADLGREDAQGSGFMRIPKVCITRRKRLS